ncbi:antirepressor [Mycobacterium phage CicholasNage]|uniref:Antirepressor n=2 Tax=Bronvirus TaxID=1623278 RepID=A0A411BPB7_9CAUD|nr:antirepressor [Mycobacterium phage CicholasNage]AZS12214.1 antirepressor [Mycobacterium phage Acquire49]QDK04064.1 antirepressor [Mycobacterium phage AvadaKedavra]QGJ92465.1 antirepressor [Mycobacterium phage Wyatt2]QOC56725.1 antirepressor [Mycobacterium phage Tyson]QWT30588.1 antirepressor [Mycobacterium phage Rose5]
MAVITGDLDLFSDGDVIAVGSDVESPFDAIKLDGERWSARDLMPLLGYRNWREFAGAIDRAKLTAQNMGEDVTRLFGSAPKKVNGGRPAEDYHLTRYAAYLVAMNGDPRKPEIAAAQTYFAVKTREAEVAKPLSGKELLAAALVEANAVLEARTKELTEAKQQVALAAPKAEFYDKFVDANGSVSVGTVAKILGLSQNKLFDRLRLIGVFIGTGHLRNTPYQRYMHHFEVKTHTVTHNDGTQHVSYTTRVRPSGVHFIAKKLGIIIENKGVE